MQQTLADAGAMLAVAGMLQAIAGWFAATRFRRTWRVARPRVIPITVLKPLCGADPQMEQALASLCDQDYPAFQVVFGVAAHDDPALEVLRRIRRRFPGRDMAVVIDPLRHGINRKIDNLINMLPAARHDVLVIADADMHAAPGYLHSLVSALSEPGTGLVTTLYSGLPGGGQLAARLGALGINHGFLPGVLLSRALGRQDCLGGTMALRRSTLIAVGGFRALAAHLADDHELGRLVRRTGLAVRLADTIPATTVPETTLHALFLHELRWARTIRGLTLTGAVASAVQYPLAWALVAVVASLAAPWAIVLAAVTWTVRAAAVRGVERALGLPVTAQFRLLPMRDVMSAVVLLASFLGNQVTWRGQVLDVPHPSLRPFAATLTETLLKWCAKQNNPRILENTAGHDRC